MTSLADVPALRSLMPSSHTTALMPDRLNTSRSRRLSADGPPAPASDTTRFPPIPSFTSEMRLPYAARRRRNNTSGHRSSPLSVEAVPSVMESPNVATTKVSAGAMTSSASRKYQEVVELGNAASPWSFPCEPAPGLVMYEVCIPLECHVIGPLVPTTWKLTASFRPSSENFSTSSTNSSSTASLKTDCPAGTVIVLPRAKVTGRFLPGTIAPALACRPRKTSSSVTALVPKKFEKRTRKRSPQRFGRTMSRNVWSFAPVSADGKANSRSGCATAVPEGYSPCADAAQDATHFCFPWPSSSATAAGTFRMTTASTAAAQRKLRRAGDANRASDLIMVPPFVIQQDVGVVAGSSRTHAQSSSPSACCGLTQTKLAASSMLPWPVYCASCG